MGNPRGSLTPWRFSNGKYALLFYNNGGDPKQKVLAGGHRRVVWVSGGVEKDGVILWAQPEIALYDVLPQVLDNRTYVNPAWSNVDGPGYYDWLESNNGEYAFVASNKFTARLHQIPSSVLNFSWQQWTLAEIPQNALALHLSRKSGLQGRFLGSVLPDLRAGSGFTIGLWLRNAQNKLPLSKQSWVDGRANSTAALDDKPTTKQFTRG